MQCKLSGKTELKRLESKSIPDVPEMEGVVGLEADIIPASTQSRQKQEIWQKEAQKQKQGITEAKRQKGREESQKVKVAYLKMLMPRCMPTALTSAQKCENTSHQVHTHLHVVFRSKYIKVHNHIIYLLMFCTVCAVTITKYKSNFPLRGCGLTKGCLA